MDELMTKRRKKNWTKKTLREEDDIKIDHIEKEISDEIADKEFKKLVEVVGELDDNTHTGVKYIKGKLITNPKENKRLF